MGVGLNYYLKNLWGSPIGDPIGRLSVSEQEVEALRAVALHLEKQLRLARAALFDVKSHNAETTNDPLISDIIDRALYDIAGLHLAEKTAEA